MKKILRDSEGGIFEAQILDGNIPQGFEDITNIMQIDESLESEEKKYLEAIEVDEVIAVQEVIAEDAVEAVDEVALVIAQDAIEAVEAVAAVEAVEAVAEHWTNGTDIVWDANDIPTLVDGETDEAYLDPEYSHVDAVEAVEAVEEVVAVEAQDAVEGVDWVAAIEAKDAIEAVEAVVGVPRHFIIQKKSTADKDRRNAILNILRELRAPLLVEADILVNIAIDTGVGEAEAKAYRIALRAVPESFIKVDGDPKVAVDSIDLENFEWPIKP